MSHMQEMIEAARKTRETVEALLAGYENDRKLAVAACHEATLAHARGDTKAEKRIATETDRIRHLDERIEAYRFSVKTACEDETNLKCMLADAERNDDISTAKIKANEIVRLAQSTDDAIDALGMVHTALRASVTDFMGLPAPIRKEFADELDLAVGQQLWGTLKVRLGGVGVLHGVAPNDRDNPPSVYKSLRNALRSLVWVAE